MDSTEYIKDLLLERYTKVEPKLYAENLKKQFQRDKSLWYKAISPKEMADKFYKDMQGDYSKLWEEYCAVCFCTIDINTSEECYVSDDKITWLCRNCYRKLFKQG